MALALPHDRPRHMRASHRPAARFLQHTVERELHPQPLELFHHGLGPAHPVGPAALEERFQLGRIGGQKVTQHVHLAPGGCGGKLAAADHPNTVALAGRQRFGDTRQRIVIGEGDGLQPGSQRPASPPPPEPDFHPRRSNARAGRWCLPGVTRSLAGAQRRYPISGAVQDG